MGSFLHGRLSEGIVKLSWNQKYDSRLLVGLWIAGTGLANERLFQPPADGE